MGGGDTGAGLGRVWSRRVWAGGTREQREKMESRG